MTEQLSLYPESWVKKGAPDIKVGPNMEKEIDAWLKKENQYKSNAKTFLSNKGVNDLETFQEEFGILESELQLFSRDEEIQIETSNIPIPNTNSQYFHKIQAKVPEEIYPHFLQWVREMSKVSGRKKGFKIPIEYKSLWDGKPVEGKAMIVAPTFRKLPKGLGVNKFGDVDMDDISRYGLDADIQKMYDKVLGHWEEFSKYLETLQPGELPQKPEWMTSDQWAEIKAIAMKEAWDEQEQFNHEMVQQLPEEIAEVLFNKAKQNYLASNSSEEDVKIVEAEIVENNEDNEKSYSI